MSSISQTSIKISDIIADIKQQFIILVNKYNDINSLLDLLNDKKTHLNEVYKNIEKSHHENNFLFGLDTFSFQNKLIDTEYNNLIKYGSLINNRIYYDYYKLILLIKKDLDKNKIEIHSDLSNTVVKYNYLNIYKKYDIKTIERIFNKIIKLIIDTNDHLIRQQNELDNYTIKMNEGLDLNNFCSFYNYKNKVVKENIKLYTNYMLFFVKLHNKYITKLDMKTRLMYMQINNEIKTDKYNTNKTDNMKTMMTYLSDSTSTTSNSKSISSLSTDEDESSNLLSDMMASITQDSPIISSLEKQPKIKIETESQTQTQTQSHPQPKDEIKEPTPLKLPPSPNSSKPPLPSQQPPIQTQKQPPVNQPAQQPVQKPVVKQAPSKPNQQNRKRRK
jgi:hypothetical protein